jgi:hypothetical protein
VNLTRAKIKPHLPVYILFGSLFFGIQTHAQVSLQIGQNFIGSSYITNSSYVPPDSNGAIGPRHYMEFINGTVSVYNRTNGVSIQRKTNVKFWSDAGVIVSPDAAVSDPRVIYDPTVQRWFASQVDVDANASDPTFEANDFLIAVSSTSDANSTWHGFLFQADPDTGYFADFPTMGLDSNAVYLSGDFYFGLDNPLGPGLVSIPKADLVAAIPTIANRTWFGVMDYAVRGQVLQPATCFDGSSTGNILAMGDIGTDSEPHSNMVTFAVQNAAGTNPTLTASTILNVSPYVVPFNSDMEVPLFNAMQPDGTYTLQANDARLSAKVFVVAGVLYAVHSTEVNGRVAIRWYRIAASTHAVLESGTIADPDLDLFFPSIAANTNGTVVIGCNGSSVNTYVSCFAVAGQTVNGSTIFGNLTLLRAGVVSYHDANELIAQLLDDPVVDSRWGDYSDVSVDPTDPTHFWTIQMFPSADSDFGGIWSTQITELIPVTNPVLSITRSNNNALISWSAIPAGFNLESKTNLSTVGGWTVVSSTFSTNNGRVQYQSALTNKNTFFRLHQ